MWCSTILWPAQTLLLFCIFLLYSAVGSVAIGYPNAWNAAGLRTRLWAKDLHSIRSIVSCGDGEFLVLQRPGSVVLMWDDDRDGLSSVDERLILVTYPGLSHGIAVDWHGGFLFASTADVVVRWPIVLNVTTMTVARVAVTAPPVQVVTDLSRGSWSAASGTTAHGHYTRTLVVNAHRNELYIQVGSIGNVDADEYRSAIRRMSLLDARGSSNTSLPIDFRHLAHVAKGVRNTVGMSIDPYSNGTVMYGVDNGPDNAQRYGADIHIDNPGEECNRFDLTQNDIMYGYPYCFSEYKMDNSHGGEGRGTQFVWTGVDRDFSSVFSDSWCRNTSNQKVPSLVMQAHSAPLGITFYGCNNKNFSGNGTLPCGDYDGWAFVAFHGSWNRQPPTGYKVVALPMESITNRTFTGQVIDVMRHNGTSAVWETNLRPVDVAIDSRHGRLLVTSDSSGEVLVIESTPPTNTTSGVASSLSVIQGLRTCIYLVLSCMIGFD
jgi:glucose/arabinose dehydrogenase